MATILTSGAEDHLIEGLSFKPPSATANYVLETRQVTYQAESGNRFDPVSSRVIRFRLADHGFLEASSVKNGSYLTKPGRSTDHAMWTIDVSLSTGEAICFEPASRGSD